ncbi:hypothetical protein MMC21_008192 [Puttea exsequens]|nr:hypothetical protein [Puttea exsequens]
MRGPSCFYEHEAPNAEEPHFNTSEHSSTDSDEERPERGPEDLTPTNSSRSRKFIGAKAQFRAGAEVAKVRVNEADFTTPVGMSSIMCTWYKPASIARLVYDIDELREDPGPAILDVDDYIKDTKLRIARRRVKTEIDFPDRKSPRHKLLALIKLSGLHLEIPADTIMNALPDDLRPIDIQMEGLSYNLTVDEVAEDVEKLLKSYGTLITTNVNASINPLVVKAVARFEKAEDARRARRMLDGERLERLDGGKLFVSPLVAINYTINGAVYQHIESSIDTLRHNLWKSGRIVLGAQWIVHDQVSVQMASDDAKAFAISKSSVQKLLQGDIAKWIWALRAGAIYELT